MQEKESTYQLKIKGDISDLHKAVNDAKGALEKLDKLSFTNGLDKKLATISKQLEALQKKASRPLTSKAAFTNLENGFSDVAEDAKALLAELNKISNYTTKNKLSLLPDEEAKRFKEAINAVTAYDKAVQKAERNRIRQQSERKTKITTLQATLNTKKEEKNKADSSIKNIEKFDKAKGIIDQGDAAKQAKKEVEQLNKELEEYLKLREELGKIKKSERSPEQTERLADVRKKITSTKSKINYREEKASKGPSEQEYIEAQQFVATSTVNVEEWQKAKNSSKELENEIENLEQTIAKLNDEIKNNSKEITESATDYKILCEQAKKLDLKLSETTENVSSENIKEVRTSLLKLAEEGAKPVEEALNQLAPEFSKIEGAAKEAGEGVKESLESWSNQTEHETRINNLKDNIKQFLGWAGASKVLSAALRNAFQDIKELDAAMTEIAVVTDFEIGDMWEQMPEYTKRANELGVSITQAYEASALFYQQGLDTNEMVALSNETLKMARIAGLDATEATDRMTAALRGFNMELNQANAQNIADVYSKLAAITASDVNEISSAMTKTASIASSAGMEFETTAAFLSQIIETTRESAETAGTAMKTVIARFQELKKDPSEIGEVDGEIVDANKIETALRSVGVSLRGANGQFRELDDVFLELSSKWDGLDKNTQRYIATIAAGSRQQSRFIAMMSDYARTQELVTAANNSAGASQEQYDKTLESIETKLTKLDNAWTEFSTGIMNSDLVKFAVDFLTNILTILNKVTNSSNGFFNSLKKMGMILSLFKIGKALFDKFGNTIIEKMTSIGQSMGLGISKGLESKLMPELDRIAKQTNEKVEEMSQTDKQEIVDQSKADVDSRRKEKEFSERKVSKVPVVRSIVQGYEQQREAKQKIKEYSLEKTQNNAKKQILEKEISDSTTISQTLNATPESTKTQGLSEALGEAGSQVNFSALPTIEIQNQYIQKLTDMGMTIDEANAKWSKFEQNIGDKTAQQGLDELNKDLEETAEKAGGKYDANASGGKGGKNIQENGKRITASKTIKNKAKDKADNTVEQQTAAIKDLDEQNTKLDKDLAEQQKRQKEGYEKISGAINKVSTGLFATSAGLGAVGSLMSSLGAENAATAFNTLASAASGVGMAMQLLQPILALVNFVMTVASAVTAIKTGVDKAQTKATYGQAAANIALMITCWPLLVVMLALIAALIIFVAVFAAIKKNSPEEKLKKTQAAADAAAEAADRAAEAYDNLNSSLEELEDKYEALEELTKGTEEWNKAVKDINKSVIDLIQKYPELAKLIKSEGGVLKLDTESTEVQQVLTQYEEASIAAANTSLYAQMQVAKAEADVTYDNLQYDEKATTEYKKDENGKYVTTPDGYKIVDDEATEKKNNALAKALASGDIYSDNGAIKTSGKTNEELVEEYGFTAEQLKEFYNQVEDDTDALKDYGEQLLKNEDAANAMYEAMATAAENLANLSMYSEQEQLEAKNLMTGDIAEQITAKVETEWNNLSWDTNGSNEGIDDMNAEQEAAFNKAIEQVYGKGAKLQDNGKVVYYDGDGNRQEEEYEKRKDELTQATISILSTDKIKQATEAAPKAIDNLNKYIAGLSTTDNFTEDSNLGGKIYHDDASLSREELEAVAKGQSDEGEGDALELSREEMKEMWKALGAEGQKAYGNDEKTFYESMEKYNQQIEQNKKAMEKLEAAGITATEELNKLDTKNLVGLANQIEQLKTASYGVDATDAERTELLNNFTDQITSLLGSTNLNDEQKEMAFSDIGSVDIYSQSALDALTARLINLYNVSQEDAIALTGQIAAISNAVDENILMVETYGELYKAQQRVEAITKRLTTLQWEYSNGIAKTSKEIETNLNSQIGLITQGATANLDSYRNYADNLAKYYAQGASRQSEKGGAAFDYRKLLDQEEFAKGNIVVDTEQYDLLTADSSFDSEIFEEWLADLKGSAEGMAETEEAAREEYEALRELEQSTKDAYYELREMAKTAVLDKIQEQIDIEQESLDATRDANNAIINKIQEQIDDQRAARELENQQRGLEDTRTQLAYLSMDTSGTNILQQQELQKSIEEQEISLGDQLIDNALQKLQDANEKAYEQRERQIALSEDALELYQESNEFQSHVDDLVDGFLSTENIEGSELYKMLEEGNIGMSDEEKEEWKKQLDQLGGSANTYLSTDWSAKQNSMYSDITAIAEEVNVQKMAREKEETKLIQEGFSDVGSWTQQQRSNASQVVSGSEGTNAEALNVNKEKFKNAGITFGSSENLYSGQLLDEKSYYQLHEEDIKSGKFTKSYAEYVQEHMNKFDQASSIDSNVSSAGAMYKSTIQPVGNWSGNHNKESYWKTNSGEFKLKLQKGYANFSPPAGQSWFPNTVYYLGDNAYIYGGFEKGNPGWKKVLNLSWDGDTAGAGNTKSYVDEVSIPKGTRFEANANYTAGTMYSSSGSLDGGTYKVEGQDLNVARTQAANGSLSFKSIYIDGKEYLEVNKDGILKGIKAYKTGGLADFTGPAWLDGTPSRPEYILNAEQTKRLFSLIDVLEGLDTSGNTTNNNSGDSYYDVSISVESLASDYDVEQLASKIRSMIVEDATYRNVNAINHIR